MQCYRSPVKFSELKGAKLLNYCFQNYAPSLTTAPCRDDKQVSSLITFKFLYDNNNDNNNNDATAIIIA
jgi:hypothetical protein